jgi:hypothetical protein
MHSHYGIYVYTVNGGYISFDSAKSQKNVLVRGAPFELAAEFAKQRAHSRGSSKGLR